MRKGFLAVVGAVLIAVLSAGGTSLFTGWAGSGVGVGGVRTALHEHEANAAMHPNVGQLNERLDNMEEQQQRTESKVDAVQQSVDTLAAEVLRSIGRMEGKLDGME